jgi:hypothetical protein
MEQAERPSELKMSVEVWISVAQCGPRLDGKHGSAEAWNHRFACVATFFVCGAGDKNRTRTVSLGTDSLQGHSPRWLRARVVARVPFRT